MSAKPMRMTWLPYDVFGIYRKCLHNYRKPSPEASDNARISLKIALMKSQWFKMLYIAEESSTRLFFPSFECSECSFIPKKPRVRVSNRVYLCGKVKKMLRPETHGLLNTSTFQKALHKKD